VISRRLLGAIVAPVLVIAALAGCTEDPSISTAGDSTGYVSGAGVYKEIKPADRRKAVSFSAKSDKGGTISSDDFAGKVHVLNFWYAGCGPCVAEAPRMEAAYKHYKGDVPFLGVNTYDAAPQANVFEEKYKISYPSVLDVNEESVQFAFSQSVPANAAPTTLIIDRHGRVAARVTGEIEQTSILTSLIDTVIKEGK
jgi:peroxiredoxin